MNEKTEFTSAEDEPKVDGTSRMAQQRRVPKCRPASKAVGGMHVIPRASAENVLSSLSYTPTIDDIFVVTYPKSGTTWTQYIVWEILNFGAPPPEMTDMQSKHVPFLEYTGLEPVKTLGKPRAMKNHFPYHLHPYHPLAKYIYMARNPKDTCISFYNHIKHASSVYKFSDGTLDDFVDCFVFGELPYGNWFDHVLGWYVHKDDPNVHFLTYEMMKREPERNILSIAGFIGKEYAQSLEKDPNLLARIVEYTSFENMKKMEFYIPKHDSTLSVPRNESEAKNFHKVSFFWRGKVGNWKEFLTEKHVERLNHMMLSKPLGDKIAALWDE